MLSDRYGLAVSTSSSAARDAYVKGCDLLLTLFPGAVDAFDHAIASDPGFALAHVAKARARQLAGDMTVARASMATATALAERLPAREASHLDVFRLIISGRMDQALIALRAHLDSWPRDAVALSATANQGGLIGLSGLAGREQALTDFLTGLSPHYGDDPWFNAHYAMALSETSQQDAARPLIERSLAQNPRNAFAAHAFAHLSYEAGEADAAIGFMRAWLPIYTREGGLHGHLNWHLALFELQSGNAAEGFRLFTDIFASEDYPASSVLKVVDGASFLWRAELAGHAHDPARWTMLRDFARKMFPKPGMSMVDWHVALTEAATGNGDALEARVREMEDMVRAGCYPAGFAVPSVMRAFAAFQRQDFATAIDAIEPMLAERERIGGSRAQVDLVEFTLLKAYLGAGRMDDARNLLGARRPGPAGATVAGLETIH